MEKLKCKVVILEASDPQVSAKGQIYLATHNTNTKYPIRLLKDNPNSSTSYRKECKRQHLYFISNEEIEKDDCFIGVTPEFERILVTPQNKKEYIGSGVFIVVKKVECSSDPSLGLPLIGQSFIEKYVEKQGRIDEVMIKMETVGQYGRSIVTKSPNNNESNADILRERKDNTVIIHPVKESWTREEVKAAFEAAREFKEGGQVYPKSHKYDTFEDYIDNQ